MDIRNAPDTETLLEMHRRMLRIRQFDDRVVALHAKGEIPGPVHTSQGQEGEVVGACMALGDEDYMVGNHRSHGHPIGKGARLAPLMAELMGKSTGVCRGKGGSMHLADFSVGSLGETSIVGAGLPIATGAALGAKMLGTGRVSLAFFGDGASNQGTFHEALNMAAIWKLPAIFLCENNGYAVTTSSTYSIPIEHVATRAASYGFPGEVVDGQEVLAVHDAVSRAVTRARSGAGPTLVEAKTYRYEDHAGGIGRDLGYRSGEEMAEWKARDPIRLFRDLLVSSFEIDGATLDTIEDEVRREVEEAVAFARSSSSPDPIEAYSDVLAMPGAAYRDSLINLV